MARRKPKGVAEAVLDELGPLNLPDVEPPSLVAIEAHGLLRAFVEMTSQDIRPTDYDSYFRPPPGNEETWAALEREVKQTYVKTPSGRIVARCLPPGGFSRGKPGGKGEHREEKVKTKQRRSGDREGQPPASQAPDV